MATPTFNELYARHADAVFRRCMLLLASRSDAEDVSQQVWVKAHFHLDRFRSDASHATWLFRIATNECLNFMRARKDVSRGDVDVRLTVPDHADAANSKIDVTNLLSGVSNEERALLVMKYLDGYSYREIADMTGSGESAVKMRVKRLKERVESREQRRRSA